MFLRTFGATGGNGVFLVAAIEVASSVARQEVIGSGEKSCGEKWEGQTERERLIIDQDDSNHVQYSRRPISVH